MFSEGIKKSIKDCSLFVFCFLIGFWLISEYISIENTPSVKVIHGDFSKYYGDNKGQTFTIYTDSKCPVCSELKLFLAEKKIGFIEKDVSISNHKREANELGFKAVPLIVLKDKLIVGFDKEVLKELITKTGKK